LRRKSRVLGGGRRICTVEIIYVFALASLAVVLSPSASSFR
jgi:hypothetical protein